MLHLVYCPVSGVSTEFEKPDNRCLPRPPGPRGEVPGQLHCRHHKQSRDHWTELYPGLDSVNSQGDIYIPDLSWCIFISLITVFCGVRFNLEINMKAIKEYMEEPGHLTRSLTNISTALLLSVLFIELILTKMLVLVGAECQECIIS